MRVLVAGATGVVGRALIPLLTLSRTAVGRTTVPPGISPPDVTGSRSPTTNTPSCSPERTETYATCGRRLTSFFGGPRIKSHDAWTREHG
ncbi:hypothetical protein [Streptomyces sp. NPDC001315]|uniref:hypothetical protein n=1 Tax=Streptomyces sp. NPDC001315 TaxID=3364562 RepID=UPI0036A4B888